MTPHIPVSYLIPLTFARLIALAGATLVSALMAFVFIEAGFIELIILNKVAVTIFTMFTVRSAVAAMRDPSDGLYKWFFRFMNLMTAGGTQEFLRAESRGADIAVGPSGTVGRGQSL